MREQDVLVLLGIAGVAATFSGFSGVVAVFGRRAHGEWFPEEQFRLANMLFISLGACLFAFVPLVGELLGLSEPMLWTAASTLMGIFCAAYFLYAARQRWRVGRSRPGRLSMWATAVFILCVSSAVVLQGLNVAAVPVERGVGPYVAGLLLLLIGAALQFAFLVLVPLSAGSSNHAAQPRAAVDAKSGRR